MSSRVKPERDNPRDDTSAVASVSSQSTADYSKYPHGSILRMIFSNFLTYDYVICRPGPRLNVIIGTNGSGKSTIICGICLALGGSPKSLGRSERLGDYIKHGTQEGSVEVFINDEMLSSPQRLKVVLKKPNNVQYFRNDSPITQRELRSIVVGYNIQVDNLCTFLAQDKVKSFSEQSPVELLENTLKAASVPLLHKRTALIDKQKNEVLMEKNMAETSKKMSAAEAEMQSLVPRVENFRKKQAMASRIKLIRKKMAITAYDHMNGKYTASLVKYEEEKRKVDKVKLEVDALDEKIKKIEKNKVGLEKQKDTQKQSVRGYKMQLDKLSSDGGYRTKIAGMNVEYKRVIDKAKSWEKDVARLRSNIETQKRNLEEAVKKCEGCDQAQKAYEEEMRRFQREWTEIDGYEQELRRDRAALESKRNQLTDINDHVRQYDTVRKRMLASRFNRAGAGEAWEWYLQHKDQFEEPLYVPLLHMRINKREDGVVLENLISMRDMAMFVFGSKNDERLLMSSGRWRISSTVVTPSDIAKANFSTSLPPELSQHGITRFASQLFSAPDPITYFFCSTNRLHQVPIGSSATKDIDAVCQLLRKYDMRLFLTDRQRVQLSISRYSGQVVTQMSMLRMNTDILTCHDASKWSAGVDTSALEAEIVRLKKAVDDRMNHISMKRSDIEQKRSAAKMKQAEWANKKKKRDEIIIHLRTEERDLKEEEASKPDVENAKAAYEEGKKRLIREEEKRLRRMIEMIGLQRKELRLVAELDMTIESIGKKTSEDRRARDDKNSEWMDMKRAIHAMEVEMNDMKKKMEGARTSLKEDVGVTTTDTNKMNPPEKAMWKQMLKDFVKESIPDEWDDLKQAEETEKSKVKLVQSDGDETDVLKMRDLQNEFERLRESYEEQGKSKETRREKMREEVEEWTEPVKEIVEHVSLNYSQFFEKLGCSGEVQLDVPESPMDVASYGIRINVRFRTGEKLRRLDHQVQSGGERSVSTMLYLLALQEECPVPFRCVDEINQGMDPTNERKVFEVMVSKLSGDGNLGKSQYFMLTPKLLSGLHYSPAVTVLIVHNGPNIDKDTYKWDMTQVMSSLRGVSTAVH